MEPPCQQEARSLEPGPHPAGAGAGSCRVITIWAPGHVGHGRPSVWRAPAGPTHSPSHTVGPWEHMVPRPRSGGEQREGALGEPALPACCG